MTSWTVFFQLCLVIKWWWCSSSCWYIDCMKLQF